MFHAPAADRFPQFPVSWYLFGASQELRRPVSRDLLGRRLVAFRTSAGTLAVLDARCSHLGCDLGNGCVQGENIQCPFHHWEYGSDGRCKHIPGTRELPPWARQASYPCVERNGFVFFFYGVEPLFPLPFFTEPDRLIAAKSFTSTLKCPWYMVGANAFDFQHLRAAHDRRLVATPFVDCPAPFARRSIARMTVAGNSLRDRLTRRFAGAEVEMTTTYWGGTLMFVTARFRRTTSYGMVDLQPLDDGGTRVRTTVFVRQSEGVLGQWLVDPVNLGLRRYFIRKFLQADAEFLTDSRYSSQTLIETDRELNEFFHWVVDLPQTAKEHGAQQMADGNGHCRPHGSLCEGQTP
jgi:nitrite reductase/ring-hydroxylating ferredoxin subunit